MTNTKFRKRSWLMMLVDLLTVSITYFLCYYYSLLPVRPLFPHYGSETFVWFYVMIVCIYMPVMFLFGVYRSVWRIAQAKEYFLCCIASMTSGFLYFVLSRLIFPEQKIPFYFYLLLTCAISLILVTIRLIYRIIRTNAQPGRRSPYTIHRAVIIGSGHTAARLIAEIENTAYCSVRPLAAVSDGTPGSAKKSIFGIPVCGTVEDLPDVCRDNGNDLIIIASDNTDTNLILQQIHDADCEVAVLPAGAGLKALRHITPGELCGGNRLSVPGGIESEINGKRILVSGVTDAFAPCLAGFIAAMSPSGLMFTDSCADALAAVRRTVSAKVLPACEFRLTAAGSKPLCAVVSEYKPDTVIYTVSSRRVLDGIETTTPDTVNPSELYEAAAACGVTTLLTITNPAVSGESAAFISGADCGNTAMRRIVLELPPSAEETGGTPDSIRRSLVEGLPLSLTRSEAAGYITASDEACLVLDALLRATENEAYNVIPGTAVEPEQLARRMARMYGMTIRAMNLPDATGEADSTAPDGIPALRILSADAATPETKKEDTDNADE